ncbi:MAG: glycosyltransferase [Patescibacteria group bacterium]
MSTVLFVGGGTLGSLNPLIAVAQELRKRQPELRSCFWTSYKALDQMVVREAGFACAPIVSSKYRRYFSLRTLVDLGVFPLAFTIAFVRLAVRRPRVVASAGSYVAVPVSIAAWVLRIPVALYQQDVELGLANRIMSVFATVRVAATPQRAKLFQRHAIAIGFALRQSVTKGDAAKARALYALHASWPTLLVIGGSSGAQHLNELVVAGVHAWPAELNILHITGEHKAPPTQREGYVQIPFTNDSLPDLYAVADIILCRAGSNVLAEVIGVGKAPIIIPLPGTQQEANALELERAGAKVFYESTLTPEILAGQVRAQLANTHYQTDVPRQLQKLWEVDGAPRFASIIQTYV